MKVICDLSATSAPHRRQVTWSPGALFANGKSGAWFDPSDLSTLFQDSAGTMPITAPGQPVGRMLDKSGNGHHAVQSSSTARPVYRSANGQHWLEYDGVDDLMVLDKALNMNAGQVVAGLVEPAGTTAKTAILSGVMAGYVAITGSGSDRSLGKNDSAVIHSVDTPAYFPMTDSSAVAIRIEGGTIYARRGNDPTEYYNATAAADGLGAANVLMAFSLAGEIPAHVEMFGMLLLPELLASADLENCIAYVNARMAS